MREGERGEAEIVEKRAGDLTILHAAPRYV
jgi:hypothetical protein